jgi:hypothetical protein
MTIKNLSPGDWITISWIGYKLYVKDNNDFTLTVSSSSWSLNDTMKFKHDRLTDKRFWTYLGNSKPNPLYNKITKLTGFVHPYILNTKLK